MTDYRLFPTRRAAERWIRDQRGRAMTQEEVAAHVGISKARVAQLEYMALRKLARRLDLKRLAMEME